VIYEKLCNTRKALEYVDKERWEVEMEGRPAEGI